LTVAKLKGQRVRDPSGHELGKIHDFIIDGDSGKIAHVVVSTGGVLGVGDKLRLLPAARLTQSSGRDFTADMAQTAFQELPSLAEKDLKGERITPALAKPEAGSSSSLDNSASTNSSHWVRASQLKDKDVRSDDHEIGKIKSVVMDLPSGQAMVLIDAKHSFAREAGKYLVPFNKLEVRSQEADYIASSLMRSDFGKDRSANASAAAASSGRGPLPSASSAMSSTAESRSSVASSANEVGTSRPDTSSSGTTPRTAADSQTSTDPKIASPSASASVATSTPPRTSSDPAVTRDISGAPRSADTANSVSPVTTPTPSPASNDEQLTPTGRTSAEQSPASGVTAMAIRHALDKDETLARENIQVSTKVVLRGSVRSEEAKRRVEELARQAVNQAEIDNQITVQPE
jgi:sporulation protein YlmC with PRC-barrel domain